MKLLININGPMAIGKSTLTTKIWRHLKNWPFVDRPMIKRGLKPLGGALSKEISKKATYEIIKDLMKIDETPGIIVAELDPEIINKKIGKEMKKYGYKLLPFRLICSVKEAEKREIQRQKERGGLKPILSHLRKIHSEFKHPHNFEVIIDTEKNSVDKSFKLMKKTIKEYTNT